MQVDMHLICDWIPRLSEREVNKISAFRGGMNLDFT
jgi:hypothetical protein